MPISSLPRKVAYAWWRCRLSVLRLLHATSVLRTKGRHVFEREVLFAVHHELRPRRMLSVGVARYTRFYERLFSGTEFETVDISADNAAWGSRRRHHTTGIADLASRIQPGAFDVILFNGVYGWGVNTDGELRSAMGAMTQLLEPGGTLVFGWNAVPTRDPLSLGDSMGDWFAGFEPLELGGVHMVHADPSRGQRFAFFRREAR